MNLKYSENDLKKINDDKNPNSIPDLVQELKDTYNVINKLKNNKLENYANILLSDISVYHNHKETMAHAAFLVEVALFGAIMTMTKWPPDWVPSICISEKTVTVAGIFIVWSTIHIFMRWQLRKRRDAAVRFAGIIRAIRKWIDEPPSTEDYKPYKSGLSLREDKFNLLDFIIVWPKAKIFSDVEVDGEPAGLVQGLREQENIGTGAVRAEYILTYGSIIIFLFIVFRTFFGK